MVKNFLNLILKLLSYISKVPNELSTGWKQRYKLKTYHNQNPESKEKILKVSKEKYPLSTRQPQ